MKAELGYYLVPLVGDSYKVPIYGLRAVPKSILKRVPVGYEKYNWQVQIFTHGNYQWINQSRHLIFLH